MALTYCRVLILVAGMFPLAFAALSATRNVIIVNIDGLRCQDGLERGNQTMPFLQDSLRPLGALYRNFLNRGITVTNAGHSTIVTGVRQVLPNNAGIPTPIRPQEPTLAEYYRAERGVPQSAVYFISGKTSIWKYPVSLFPGYGDAVAPTITLTSSSDVVTWDSARVILDRDHPSLVYILFAQVDVEGHTADSSKYFSAIHRVDSLIALLWRFLREDSVYRDGTTLIVTSDHGRHDDVHGGWQGHGDYCHGCRHVTFLAVGPEITPGFSTNLARDQIDIAPTVAALLGFHAPLAQGEVLQEMFRVAPSSPPVPAPTRAGIGGWNGSALSGRSPAVASTPGALHLAYTVGSPGSRSIQYLRSSNGGDAWSEPVDLFSAPECDYLFPAIAGAEGGVLVGAATGMRELTSDSTSVWILECRRSSDAGLSWGPPRVLDTLTTISSTPAVAVSGARVSIVAMMGYRVWVYISTDGGETFSARQIHAGNSTTPACSILDTTVFAAWRHLNKDSLPYWNILYDRNPWRAGDHPVTENDTTSYSYAPSLEADGDSLVHLVYQHLETASGENDWRLMYRKLRGRDGIWGQPVAIAPDRTIWTPTLRRSPSGDLHAVWADYHAMQWSIYSSISTDHGVSWASAVQRTSTNGIQINPSLAFAGDTAVVAWESWDAGTPSVILTRFSVYETRRVPLAAGWNLLSLPVEPDDRSIDGVFHCAPFCNVMGFDSAGYYAPESVHVGSGYWRKVTSAGEWAVRGRPVSQETVAVHRGWNLIGCVSDTVSSGGIVSVPPGNINWPAFGFGPAGYFPVDGLAPGRGYWIRAAGAGLLVLP